MSDTLKALYESQLEERKRDITSSTPAMFTKAHPRSAMSYDYYAEILGLSVERLKTLPLKAIEALHDGLVFLLSKMKEDPMLRQRFRKFINDEFKKAEEEEFDTDKLAGGLGKMRESVEGHEEFVDALSEAVSAAKKFNYVKLQHVSDNNYRDKTVFIPTLMTIDETLLSLPPQQLKGILAFLKSLALQAENDIKIRYILNRLLVIDTNDTPVAPVRESKEVIKESKATDLFAKLGLDANNKDDKKKFVDNFIDLCLSKLSGDNLAKFEKQLADKCGVTINENPQEQTPAEQAPAAAPANAPATAPAAQPATGTTMEQLKIALSERAGMRSSESIPQYRVKDPKTEKEGLGYTCANCEFSNYHDKENYYDPKDPNNRKIELGAKGAGNTKRKDNITTVCKKYNVEVSPWGYCPKFTDDH
jgi:hypothetical protein